jgi:hypothetical protein
MTEIQRASTEGRSRASARRRFARPVASVSLGLVITGLTSLAASNAGAASSITSNKPFAQAQLLKRANLPRGWTQQERVWVGTSADENASSMMTMTQIPDLSTCLGRPPALSVVAAEASSPVFVSKDQNTTVIDVADVYTSTVDAKNDYPLLSDPKFARCFLKVEGSSIVEDDKFNWPSGATFGSPIASVSHPRRYGDQSGLLDVQVPVNLSDGEGSTNDFFVVLVIRQGRSTAELLIDQGDTTPSAALTESLAKAVTLKMKARPPGKTRIAPSTFA